MATSPHSLFLAQARLIAETLKIWLTCTLRNGSGARCLVRDMLVEHAPFMSARWEWRFKNSSALSDELLNAWKWPYEHREIFPIQHIIIIDAEKIYLHDSAPWHGRTCATSPPEQFARCNAIFVDTLETWAALFVGALQASFYFTDFVRKADGPH